MLKQTKGKLRELRRILKEKPELAKLEYDDPFKDVVIDLLLRYPSDTIILIMVYEAEHERADCPQ